MTAPGVAPVRPGRRGWLVAAGYVLALVGAGAFVAWRQGLIDPRDAAASSGMHAFGEVVSFLAVASVLSLVPTFLLLRILRESERGSAAVSKLLLLWAATAPVAVLATAAASSGPAGQPMSSPFLALASAFGILRLFVSPVALVAILLAAGAFAQPRPRRRLRRAAGLEAAGLVALAAWLVRALWSHRS